MEDHNIKYILDAVTIELTALGYKTIRHKRISFLHHYNIAYAYQGLSVVCLHHNGPKQTNFIIKWTVRASHNEMISEAKDQSTATLESVFCNTIDNGINNDLHNEYIAITALNYIPCVIECLDYFFVDKPYKNHVYHQELKQLNLTKIKPITLSYLRYPYYPLGNIKTFLKNQQQTQDNQTYWLRLKMVCTQIIEDVQQIHQAGWIHGDIKPSNIMINYCHDKNNVNQQRFKKRLHTVFIDFSLATKTRLSTLEQEIKDNNVQTVDGTPAYLAPECWRGVEKSLYSDYYALGITLYELLTGQKPFLTQKNNHCHTQQPEQSLPKTMERWQNYHHNLTLDKTDFIKKVQQHLMHEQTTNHYTDNIKQLFNAMAFDEKSLQFIDRIYHLIDSLLAKNPQKRQLKTL